MAFAQPGQYGPAALLDTSGLPVIGAAVQAPAGYTAVVDELGNLTVIGPPADAVACSYTPVGGVATSFVITVPPAVADLDVSAQVAAAETRASGTYVPKALSKRDGQNVKNLRRPTLLIDKAYPSGMHDHEILHVDETAKVSYALGQDRRIRKNTWVVESSAADSFGSPRANSGAFRFALHGVFFREPGANSIITTRHDSNGNNLTLQRSTDDGSTFVTVWTAPANVGLLGPWSIARDAVTGHLFMVEYITVDAATRTAADIWRSTDNGATWAVWKTMPRSGAGSIRHWHGARYDSVSQRVYFFSGDTESAAGMYRVNAAGTDIEPVVLNSHGVTLGLGSDVARSIDAMFFATHIAWPADSALGGIYRLARTQIGAATPAVEKVADINGTGWGAVRASADSSVWVCSTSTEAVASQVDPAPHLYAVSDNGAQVDEIGSVTMESGGQLGFASISGLAQAGEGDTFWLRAHNFRAYPNRNTSAFQWRCRVVWGVTGQIKQPAARPQFYDTKTLNGSGTLVASESLTFGHLRAPREAKVLTVLDLGVRKTTGTGSVAVQLWNVTTNTLVAQYTGSTYRYDGADDTGQRYGEYYPAAGDVIEARILETGGVAGATALAYVTFGWSF